jgi:hypothetical protein
MFLEQNTTAGTAHHNKQAQHGKRQIKDLPALVITIKSTHQVPNIKNNVGI